MNESELKELSTEKLEEKLKGIKVFIGVFVVIIIALSFFVISDYLSTDEMDISSLTITICAVGGMASLFPELKKIKEELELR